MAFNNILVPVDFSDNTNVAIEKALWLANPGQAILHLLHIVSITAEPSGSFMHGFAFISTVRPQYQVRSAQARLQDMKVVIQQAHKGITVITHVVQGDAIQKGIIKYAGKLLPDLVVIGKTKNHSWLPFLKIVNASAISKLSHCPVLTVKPGAVPNTLKSVVIPVGSFVPRRKIDLLTALTRNHRPLVHLVALEKDTGFSSRPAIFLETYKLLTEHLHYPVHYSIINGDNTGKAILKYARSAMADIVMVDPYEESSINQISGMQINDLIIPTSKITVLTAEPYHINHLKQYKRSTYETNN